MRIKHLPLVFLIFSNIVCKSQTLTSEPVVLVCTYRLTYQPDSTAKYLRTEYMNLSLGKNISKFESQGSHLQDSLLNSNNAVPASQVDGQAFADAMISFPRTDFRYIIYKNSSIDRISYYDRLGAANIYRMDEPANLFNWKITSNTATVAGYVCQRATTSFAGREYEAWFTREIPILEGPYKFYGLPGLIIKVNDTRNHYVFELMRLIKPRKSFIIDLPSKAVATTKQEFRKGKAAYEFTLPDRMAAMTIGSANAEALRRKAQEQARRKNNPLELK